MSGSGKRASRDRKARPEAPSTRVEISQLVPLQKSPEGAGFLNRRVVEDLGSSVGNRATTAYIRRHHKPAQGNDRVQRVGSNQATSAPAPASPTPTAAPAATGPVELDGLTFTTAAELGSWYRLRLAQLGESATEIAAGGQGYDVGLGLTRVIGMANLEECRADPAAPAGKYAATALTWRSNWVAAMNQAEDEKLSIAAGKLREAEATAQAAADSLDNLLPKLRDSQRDAFKSENESQLLNLGDAIAGVLDCSLATKDSLNTIATTLSELRFASSAATAGAGMKVGMPIEKGTFTPRAADKIPKVLGCLEKINKTYAAFQTARAAITIVTGGSGTTVVAKGGSMIKASATLFSSVGTLVGASAHVGLYANLYLGPMTEAAIKSLDRLSRILSDDNQQSIGEGYFGMVRWGNEPGGRPMCEFMVKVMKASDPSEIPSPIPSAALKYFDDQQDAFESGVSTKTSTDEMPEDGYIFKDLNEPKMRRWLFRNRASVWGMLYGSTPVPSKIRESPLDQ